MAFFEDSVEKAVGLAATCGWIALGGGLEAGVALTLSGVGIAAAASHSLRGHGPESKRALKAIRKRITADLRQTEQAKDWVNREDIRAADAALDRALAGCFLDRKSLAASARSPEEFPEVATKIILSKLAEREPKSFGPNGTAAAKEYAKDVIHAALEAAIENETYFKSLDPHLTMETLRGLGELKVIMIERFEEATQERNQIKKMLVAIDEKLVPTNGSTTAPDNQPKSVLTDVTIPAPPERKSAYKYQADMETVLWQDEYVGGEMRSSITLGKVQNDGKHIFGILFNSSSKGKVSHSIIRMDTFGEYGISLKGVSQIAGEFNEKNRISRDERYVLFNNYVFWLLSGELVFCIRNDYGENGGIRARSADFSLVHTVKDNSNNGFIIRTDNGTVVSKVNDHFGHGYATGSSFTRAGSLITCTAGFRDPKNTYFRCYVPSTNFFGRPKWKCIWTKIVPITAASSTVILCSKDKDDTRVFCINDGTVHVLSTETGEIIHEIVFQHDIQNSKSVRVSPAGKFVIGCSTEAISDFRFNGVIQRLELDASLRWEIKFLNSWITDVKFSPSGNVFTAIVNENDAPNFLILCDANTVEIIEKITRKGGFRHHIMDDCIIFSSQSKITKINFSRAPIY